jgi:REP-associated tyrosine transposase
MTPDELLHHGHRSIRLPTRDYSALGIYYVTICTEKKRCILGRIENAQTNLTAVGKIVRECWLQIPSHFANACLHAFVIMPNHVHGLIEFVPGVEVRPNAQTRRGVFDSTAVRPSPLSAIVRSFKAAVTKRARIDLHFNGDVWQRNYFERVVRDGQEFSNATRYIAENPLKWASDRENPDGGKIQ